MDTPIRNKVAESGIITIDLAAYSLEEAPIVLLDIKEYLFRGLILREKDFRAALKEKDWQAYKDKNVGIICSADAIVPQWAYMLLMTYLLPVAKKVYTGDQEEVKKRLLLEKLHQLDIASYQDARIVIKGCGDLSIGDYAYAEITKLLLPVAKSIMYGEPCSTVPVYKKK